MRPYSYNLLAFTALRVGLLAGFVWALGIVQTARADCTQVGSLVTCDAIDFDGFLTIESGLTVAVQPDSLVRNIQTTRRRGNCPLSLPAISLGDNSVVTNDGRFLTFGVCGTAIETGTQSTVINNGLLETKDILSHGIATGAESFVTNNGTITTSEFNAHGISVDDRTVVENTANGIIRAEGIVGTGITGQNSVTVANSGTIETVGTGGHGITLLDNGSVTNTGTIAFAGFQAVGIRINEGTVTVTNSGGIAGTYQGSGDPNNPSDGIQVSGTNASVSNGGTIDLTGPLSAGIRVTVNSGTAVISNSGLISAQSSGLNARAGTSTLLITNTGVISAQSPGSVGVLLDTDADSTSVLTNSGTLSGTSFGVLGGSGHDQILNSGIIEGRIVLGGGNDRVNLLPGSQLNAEGDTGLIDGGSGTDELVLSGGGDLETRIVGFEELLKFGPGEWRISGEITFSDRIRIAEGTLSVDQAATVSSSAVTVFDGGVLDLRGEIIGNVENQGVLVVGPGSTITGTFNQTPSGSVTGNFADGRLLVNGTAALAGTIQVTASDLPIIRSSTTFTVIEAEAVTGAVNGVDVIGNNFIVGTPVVDATTLQIQLNRLPYESVAQSVNGAALAAALDKALTIAPEGNLDLIRTIDALSQNAAAEAFDTLATTAPLALTQLSLLSGRTVINSQILRNLPEARSSALTTWGFVERHFGSFDGDSDGRYTWRSTYLGAGVDFRINETQSAGASLIHANASAHTSTSTVDAPSTFLSLRYGIEHQAWTGQTALVFGTGESRSTRLSGLEGVNPVRSDADADVFGAAARLGRTVKSSLGLFNVSTGISYIHTSRDGVQDQGTGIGRLDVASVSADRARVDARLAWQAETGNFSPRLELGVAQALSDTRLTANATLISLPEASAGFQLSPEERTWVEWALHVPYEPRLGVVLAFSAAGTLNDKTGGQMLGLRATVAF